MQRVAEWLEKLGMSEYTQRFAGRKADIGIGGSHDLILDESSANRDSQAPWGRGLTLGPYW